MDQSEEDLAGGDPPGFNESVVSSSSGFLVFLLGAHFFFAGAEAAAALPPPGGGGAGGAVGTAAAAAARPVAPLLVSGDRVPGTLSPGMIRVRTQKSLSSVSIISLQLSQLVINHRLLPIKPTENLGLRSLQFTFTPRGKLIMNYLGEKKTLPSGSTIHLRASLLQQDSKLLGSDVTIKARKTGFDVIQNYSLNEYLLGVISKEVPMTWPDETLKAQVLASKSYALSVMAKRKKWHFDVEGTVLDQHFDSDILFLHGDTAKRLRRLIAQVGDYQLLDDQNRIYRAFFHSDCGGKTVSAQSVWGGRATKEVADPYCIQEKKYSWKFVFPEDPPAQLKGENGLASFDALSASGGSSARAASASASASASAAAASVIPRWDEVYWKGSWLGINQFRESLGFEKVKSSRFRLVHQGKQAILVGEGFGHGVGLCQKGSYVMGKRGFSFDQILSFYYPDAILSR